MLQLDDRLHSLSPSRAYGDLMYLLQDIVALLEDQLRPLVEAESSVLVDIIYRAHLLFAASSENRTIAANGGFIAR